MLETRTTWAQMLHLSCSNVSMHKSVVRKKGFSPGWNKIKDHTHNTHVMHSTAGNPDRRDWGGVCVNNNLINSYARHPLKIDKIYCQTVSVQNVIILLCAPLISRHTQQSAFQLPLILKTDRHKLTDGAFKTENSKFSRITEFLSLYASFLRDVA